MKFHITALLFLLFSLPALSKTEVFKIKRIIYKGQVYSGALIASEVETTRNEVHLTKPRVLVYNMRLGSINATVELMEDGDRSPLCQNLGFKYTVMHDGAPGGYDKLLARFVTKDEVRIMEPGTAGGYSTRSYVSCH